MSSSGVSFEVLSGPAAQLTKTFVADQGQASSCLARPSSMSLGSFRPRPRGWTLPWTPGRDDLLPGGDASTKLLVGCGSIPVSLSITAPRSTTVVRRIHGGGSVVIDLPSCTTCTQLSSAEREVRPSTEAARSLRKTDGERSSRQTRFSSADGCLGQLDSLVDEGFSWRRTMTQAVSDLRPILGHDDFRLCATWSIEPVDAGLF